MHRFSSLGIGVWVMKFGGLVWGLELGVLDFVFEV